MTVNFGYGQISPDSSVMELYFLLLAPVNIAIAWITVFVVQKRYRNFHDRVFLAFLSCCGLSYYIEMRALVEGTNSYTFLALDNLLSAVGLSICPLLFCYMRTLTRDFRPRIWYHILILPAIVIGGVGTSLSFIVGWDNILEMRRGGYLSFIPDLENSNAVLYKFVNITLFNIIIEVMSVFMVSLCIFYLYRYIRKAEDFFANLEDASVGRLKRFLILSILLMLTFFVIIFLSVSLVGVNKVYYLFFSLPISYILYCMSCDAYRIKLLPKHQEMIKELMEDGVYEPTLHETRNLELLVDSWIARPEKPFCAPGLTLSHMAEDLGQSTRSLSRYINQSKGMNFKTWINTLRIEEAKRLLQEDPNSKYIYIANLCGYPDLPTFSKVFRNIEGMTPHEYRQHITH